MNFLDTTSDDKDLPRFVIKKWIEVYDQSEGNYNVNKEIRIKTSMLRSDLCDFNDVYILVKETITVANPDGAKRNKEVEFKNNEPFINCISKVNGIKVDNTEDLDVAMSIYNILEYSKNYRKTTGNLWSYQRDEPSDPLSSDSEYFKYKTIITGNTYNAGAGEAGCHANKVGKNENQVFIPLKHLSNFWRSLNIPLINCEVELILTWSKNCVLVNMIKRDAEGGNPAIIAPTELEFKITNTKLYVPVVTLSKENDTKLLEQLKRGFKRTIKWNKYRSQMTVQSNNNNLNYLIDPTFTNVIRLFILSFQRIAGENNTTKDYRGSFSYYYVPKVEIKDFNVLIDRKSFFDLSVKNEEEVYEKIIDVSNNNDYTTGNLLDFGYFKEIYKLIAIDLSKPTKLKDPQQISFIGKLENQVHGATMFFIIEKSNETTCNFLQNSVNIL